MGQSSSASVMVAAASVVMLVALSGSVWARPPAGQPDASKEGGAGFNPGASSGSGSRPSHDSGASGGANPGHGDPRPPGHGGSRPPGHDGGHGAWNGHEGEGWNPGNSYRPAVIKGWNRLGSAEAGKGADKDTIQAYGSYRYSAIKLCVRRADVKFHDARVVFVKDGQQDLRLNYKVDNGECTPVFNLRGGRRSDIRYVYLFFRQDDNILNWRTAEVDLYAR
jgi:hypothetical protein